MVKFGLNIGPGSSCFYDSLTWNMRKRKNFMLEHLFIEFSDKTLTNE